MTSFAAANPTQVAQSPSGRRGRIAQMVMSLGAIAVTERLIFFFGTIYTRRTLGAEAIGVFSWNAAVLGYFLLSINPGLETVAKREVAVDPARAARYGSWLLGLQCLLGGVAFLATVLLALSLPRDPAVRALLVLQAISLVLIPFDFTWLAQARERMPAIAGVNVVLQLLQLPAFVLLLHRPADVTLFVLIPYPFRIALIAYTGWYCVRHDLVRLRDLRFRLRGASALLREAMPIGMSQAAVLLYYNTDAIILGIFAGNRAVGLYTTAYRLMLLPTFVYQATFPAFLPSLARAAKDRDGAGTVAEDFFRVHAYLGLAAGALTWGAGRHILAAMYGPGYAEEGRLYEWLSLNLPLIFLNVGLMLPFATWGLQRLQLKISCVAAVVNVALNALLVPRFGAPAAVTTTLLAEAVVLCWAGKLRSTSVHPIPWIPLLVRPMILSVVTAVAVRAGVDRWPAAWVPIAAAGGLGLSCGIGWVERHRLAVLIPNRRSRARTTTGCVA
jgi:O-antigen/teichoic acid export membrane protein